MFLMYIEVTLIGQVSSTTFNRDKLLRLITHWKKMNVRLLVMVDQSSKLDTDYKRQHIMYVQIISNMLLQNLILDFFFIYNTVMRLSEV